MAKENTETEVIEAPSGGSFDFSNAQVQKTVDEGDGAWMHICHPTTGEPLFNDGKPCEVKVLWVDSDRYGALTRGLDMTILRKGRKMSREESKRLTLKRAAAAITAFRNVVFEGRELDGAKQDDKLLWVGLAPNFIDQVQTFAADAEHFFDSGSGS